MEFEKMEFILPGSSELTQVIYYARYADDMLFGIPILGGGGLSYDLKILLEDTLGRVFSELRLEYTSKELRRWRVHVEKRSPGA